MLARDQRPVYGAGEWEIDLARRELRMRGETIPIGGRAFEIVEALVLSHGGLVSKDELMTRVWPGAIVEESTLHVHVSAIRKAFGPARGMLRTASGRGYQLLGAWAIRQENAAPVTAARGPARLPSQSYRTNVPAAGSRLVGRATAVRHLQDVLSAYRVVTLTGPGGIGKTALAMEVARGLFPTFDGDCLVAELVSLSDPRLVPTAVATGLELNLGVDVISAESVARAIGQRKLLLVLDNCEHVIDAAATLAEALVRLCPRTSILATSQEILRIEGEYVWRVPPLEVPPRNEETPEIILEHGAVQLFVARTKEWRADFSPTAEDLPAIIAVCRRLDGIPLAIEFAAARAATLGVRQVAARLDDRLRLLTDGRRTALPRHQTLRATLDWSYELLPESEQRLLRRLAIFPAGFTMEAASAVAADSAKGASTVVEGIAHLVAKSLVILGGSEAARRWRLLETTRAYALEKLAEHGEAEQVARDHAEYHQRLFEQAEPRASMQSKAAWLAAYGYEIDDVRAALDWCFSPSGDPAIGIALTVATTPLWMHLSLMTECRERVERALAAVDARRDERRAMQLFAALGGALLYTTGPGPETNAAWTHALEIATRLDENDYRFRALWGLWVSRLNNGEHLAALALANEYRGLVANAKHPVDALIGDRMLGFSLHFMGDQANAQRHIEHMLDRYVPASDQSHIVRFHYDQAVTARATLAMIHWLRGFPDQAMHTVENSIADAMSIDHAVSLCSALAQGACPLALFTGDLTAAERFISLLLDHSEIHRLDIWHAIGLCFKDVLRIRQGDVVAGLHALRCKLAALPHTRFARRYTSFLAEAAAALGRVGRIAEGIEVIDEAIAQSESNEERFCFAELLRIKGQLLLPRHGKNATIAEDCFSQSLRWARQQGALAWELRTALSLSGLWRTQRRDREAHDVLASVYGRFTEGFDTADLRAAKRVLAEVT
jgi:predicted ATPase/DNA-binding winged helix-turn-helix (wHTH) protein